eukprot:TRINITY_DN4037_c0_g1_i1.p1 TRINITY_DN4037_c0_g1~~TRINITY_DN4037_c0_g1_i1.p1  ORF type:complete len:596 (-),score=62.90 TRINITY_DN4037_c0_g1_i1:963-2750(-)
MTQIGMAMCMVKQRFGRSLSVDHIQRLLDAGADPSRPFIRSLRHFHVNGPHAELALGNCYDMAASMEDKKALVKLLVDHAIKTNLPPSAFFNGQGRTILFDPQARSVLQEWRPLLEHLKARHDGFDLMACLNENGDNALTHFLRETAFRSYYQTSEEDVNAWLELGADPCVINNHGSDILTFLVRFGQIRSCNSLFEILLASRKLAKRLKALLKSERHETVAEYLAGAFIQSRVLFEWMVDRVGPECLTILLAGSFGKKLKFSDVVLKESDVRLLVSKGAQLDGIRGVCESPLFAAAERGWGSTSDLLISLGARSLLSESESVLHSFVRGRRKGYQVNFQSVFGQFVDSGKQDFLLAAASALCYFGISICQEKVDPRSGYVRGRGEDDCESVIESCLSKLVRDHDSWIARRSDEKSRVFVFCLLLLPIDFSSDFPRMKLIQELWPLVQKLDPYETLAGLMPFLSATRKYSPLDWLIRSIYEYEFMVVPATWIIPKLARAREEWFRHSFTYSGAVQYLITQYPSTGTKEEKKEFMKLLQMILDAFCDSEANHESCGTLFSAEIRIHRDAEIIKQLKSTGYLSKSAHKKPFEQHSVL